MAKILRLNKFCWAKEQKYLHMYRKLANILSISGVQASCICICICARKRQLLTYVKRSECTRFWSEPRVMINIWIGASPWLLTSDPLFGFLYKLRPHPGSQQKWFASAKKRKITLLKKFVNLRNIVKDSKVVKLFLCHSLRTQLWSDFFHCEWMTFQEKKQKWMIMGFQSAHRLCAIDIVCHH
jgi:hypothetical protein